jgi:hypothetical protein
MMKIVKDRWDKNQNLLRAEFEKKTLNDLQWLRYKDLVVFAFEFVYNDDDDYNVKVEHIVEIDDGDYQGTLIYTIPFDVYQPSEGEYLMTFVGYGSCSCCDTLQAIQCQDNKDLIVNDLMTLCLHILANTIKPYNFGWHHSDLFDVVEVD